MLRQHSTQAARQHRPDTAMARSLTPSPRLHWTSLATALAEDLDKLSALRIGADDYVVKPFNPLELVARARAVLRRTQARAPERKRS